MLASVDFWLNFQIIVKLLQEQIKLRWSAKVLVN